MMGDETETVSGLIIPADWDKDGNIISAAIFDREEKQYVIKQDKRGKELLKLIHEELEVEGVIKNGKESEPLYREYGAVGQRPLA